jgi:hypothetical protein
VFPPFTPTLPILFALVLFTPSVRGPSPPSSVRAPSSTSTSTKIHMGFTTSCTCGIAECVQASPCLALASPSSFIRIPSDCAGYMCRSAPFTLSPKFDLFLLFVCLYIFLCTTYRRTYYHCSSAALPFMLLNIRIIMLLVFSTSFPIG